LLYLTEFGYHNRPESKGMKNVCWHTESIRASWLNGIRKNGKRGGALDNALRSQARWMLYYHSVEVTPAERDFNWDTGLIGLVPDENPGDASVHVNDDIVGNSNYGKTKERGGKYVRPPTVFSTRRRAYCAIRQWARTKHYAGVTRCPAPGT
jgi:hypothetical protein